MTQVPGKKNCFHPDGKYFCHLSYTVDRHSKWTSG